MAEEVDDEAPDAEAELEKDVDPEAEAEAPARADVLDSLSKVDGNACSRRLLELRMDPSAGLFRPSGLGRAGAAWDGPALQCGRIARSCCCYRGNGGCSSARKRIRA